MFILCALVLKIIMFIPCAHLFNTINMKNGQLFVSSPVQRLAVKLLLYSNNILDQFYKHKVLVEGSGGGGGGGGGVPGRDGWLVHI